MKETRKTITVDIDKATEYINALEQLADRRAYWIDQLIDDDDEFYATTYIERRGPYSPEPNPKIDEYEEDIRTAAQLITLFEKVFEDEPMQVEVNGHESSLLWEARRYKR